MPYLLWSYNPDLSLVGKVTEVTEDEARIAVADCWATVVDVAESPPAPPLPDEAHDAAEDHGDGDSA